MDRFRKILVSVDAAHCDEAPQSLVRARKLAEDTGAELRVVDVTQQLPVLVRKIFHGDNAADELLAAEHGRRLNSMCQGLTAEGIKLSTAVLHGRPFVQLIREVESQGCDLLMRDASGGDEKGSLFFGSLDMRLMRNCPCPVWMVRPKPVAILERVLVAVDPFPADDEGERLNSRLVDLAASVADSENGTLHVVSAWTVRGEPLLKTKMRPNVFHEHVDEIWATGQQNLRRTLRRLVKPPSSDHIRYRKGEPSDVITRYAKDIDADVIVMGTLARSGVPGMLIGNTAERVLRQVRCSVLTVKRKGFVSPVLAELADQSPSNSLT